MVLSVLPDLPGRKRDRLRRPVLGTGRVMAKTHAAGGVMAAEERDRMPDEEFAFPKERKEPLTDARHVRNAIARFDQVEGVSDAERDQAWRRILAAAKRYDVEVSEASWRDLGKDGKDRKR
jgi:hypothetical protein